MYHSLACIDFIDCRNNKLMEDYQEYLEALDIWFLSSTKIYLSEPLPSTRSMPNKQLESYTDRYGRITYFEVPTNEH